MQKLILTQCLDWEEGAVYRYDNRFLRINHGLLLSSLTGEEGDWYVDSTVKLNDVFFLKEAIKVESKKYYLKHKFLNGEGINYLNLHINGTYSINDTFETSAVKTSFNDKEIEEIEATGFDLCNFEKVEIEDE